LAQNLALLKEVAMMFLPNIQILLGTWKLNQKYFQLVVIISWIFLNYLSYMLEPMANAQRENWRELAHVNKQQHHWTIL
jgi:hypothetical protein